MTAHSNQGVSLAQANNISDGATIVKTKSSRIHLESGQRLYNPFFMGEDKSGVMIPPMSANDFYQSAQWGHDIIDGTINMIDYSILQASYKGKDGTLTPICFERGRNSRIELRRRSTSNPNKIKLSLACYGFLIDNVIYDIDVHPSTKCAHIMSIGIRLS